jgi:hypothetical protein
VSNFINDFALIAAGFSNMLNMTATSLKREESLAICFTIQVAKNKLFNAKEE